MDHLTRPGYLSRAAPDTKRPSPIPGTLPG
nr:MAG TPA: hypothetical protein [Caudoviricetes sp.]